MELKLRLLKNDSWLEPFENAINGRHAHVMDKVKELTNNGRKTLTDFASGHLYFGLHRKEISGACSGLPVDLSEK